MENGPVLLIGDSITEGFNEKELLPELNIQNYGVSGDSTLELFARIESAWFVNNPHTAFVCIGTNDFARQRTDEFILDNIQKIINRIKEFSPAINIIPVSIFPTRDNPPRPNERIREFNRKLTLLAKENGLSYFDINRYFSDEQGKLKSTFTQDGLHLTKEAYKLWAGLISEYLMKP
ncbi:MAG: GDSL-type esterase/lipase family protein [Syntrophothermus sp.]